MHYIEFRIKRVLLDGFEISFLSLLSTDLRGREATAMIDHVCPDDAASCVPRRAPLRRVVGRQRVVEPANRAGGPCT